MTRHLDRDQLDLAVAGLLTDPDALAHLEDCVTCRRTMTGFQEVIETRRAMMERETPDWGLQRQQILDRLPDHPALVPVAADRRWVRPLLAAAATVLIAVGGGLVFHRSDPAPPATTRTEMNVEEILAETDSLLDAEGIPGFHILDDVTDEDVDALFGSTNS